jgi:acid phosphatase type 7
MRDLRSYVLGSVALLVFAFAGSTAASCSNGEAPPPSGDAGGSGGSGGSGGTTGSGKEGGSGTSCGTGCYAPLGCSYQVAPPEDANREMGYKNFSVDTSTQVKSTAGATPQRVRLGLGGNTAMGQPGYADPTTTAVFTWETVEQDSNAKVQMGTSPSALTDVHTGYAFTAAASLGDGAFNMHEVHVCGLLAGTTYYYQVGGGAPGKEVWSATQSFTTVPATGALKIGIYGDARDSATVWETVNERMKTAGVAMHLISGDVVLVGGIESEWSQWLDAIWTTASEAEAGVSSQGPFLTLGQQLMVPIAGNHEAESPDFYANFAIPGTGDWAKTYASFNVGNAHVVVVDDSPLAAASSPTSLSPEATAQVAWLKTDLAAANMDRTAHPFIIVVSHRGMFSTSNHSADSDVLLTRAVLAPIYDTYHVDLALNGHDHEYERSHPLNANATDPSSNDVVIQTDTTKGTTYVINAGAGASAYNINSENEAYRAFSWEFDFSTGYVGCYGILELEGNTLTMTEYGIKGMASADTVVDTLTLTR